MLLLSDSHTGLIRDVHRPSTYSFRIIVFIVIVRLEGPLNYNEAITIIGITFLFHLEGSYLDYEFDYETH
jgi:hypothetical protein